MYVIIFGPQLRLGAKPGRQIIFFEKKRIILKKALYLRTDIGTQIRIISVMAVVQITSREFREKQASMFALADAGTQVVIRRRGKLSYMLTPVYEEDFVLSPEVEERLEEGRRQYKAGNVTTFKTKEELNKFLDTL